MNMVVEMKRMDITAIGNEKIDKDIVADIADGTREANNACETDIVDDVGITHEADISGETRDVKIAYDTHEADIADMESVIGRMLSNYGNALLRMCFLYLKDVHLAEDAVQETFIKIYRKYSGFNHNADEKTWITRIAINVCKNYLRNPWRKHVDESAVLEDIPSDGGIAGAQDDRLIAEIMRLSVKYKDVIILYYYQSLKIREISHVLKIPEATVSTRLGRARGMLKKRLKGWYYDE